MRRIIAALAALTTIAIVVPVMVEAATPVSPICVKAESGDGWLSVARSIAPVWYAQATGAQRNAFANELAYANGKNGRSAPLYLGEIVCYDPASVPVATTTTTTSTATTTTVAPTTTVAASTTSSSTLPATTTTAAPTTTTSSTTLPATTTTVAPTTTLPATTTTVAGFCTAPPNTPGGSDGRGGCFPGPGTVGVPAGTQLTPYTGPCTITVNNTIIDSKTVNCDITIHATGVIVRRSHVNGFVATDDEQTPVGAFRLEDSFVDGTPNGPEEHRSVGYANFTVINTEVVGGQGGIWCVRNCTIQNTWVHGTDLCQTCQPGWHASAIRVEQHSTLIHNTIACDWPTPDDDIGVGCSADMTGYPDFAPITHNTMDGNLYIANNRGAAFCAYGGGTGGKEFSNDPTNATYIVFRNNVFQRGTNDPDGINQCADYGPIDSFISGRTGNVWTNNRFDDGSIVQPDG